MVTENRLQVQNHKVACRKNVSSKQHETRRLVMDEERVSQIKDQGVNFIVYQRKIEKGNQCSRYCIKGILQAFDLIFKSQ